MKIQRQDGTGFVRVVGIYGTSGGYPSLKEALADYKRIKRNTLRRQQNEMLRDITGTPASQARLDMGLGGN